MDTITHSSHPVGWFEKMFIAMGDIKLAHSVFALPFAILGAFLVAPFLGDHPDHGIDWKPFAGMLALVIVCMVFARNFAMLFNRVVDAQIDADNPRTQRRAFASGSLKLTDGYLFLAFNAIAFMIACSLFWIFFANPWPTILGAPVLVWIGFYSLTKRFTWLCHVFLGGALAASPIAAAIAVGPENIPHTPAIFWIAAMVLSWVAGFDIIYALQDLDFDQRVGLHSIPAKFGWKRAAWISRVLHLISIACLIFAWRIEPKLDVLFLIAISIVSIVLVYEHVILVKRGRAGIPMAFFTLNGIVSLVLGMTGCVDVIL